MKTRVLLITILLMSHVCFAADPKLTPSQQGLLEAGRKYPGAKVCQSSPHPELQRLATYHAKYQAYCRTQGHQNWDHRMRTLRKRIGNFQFAEICAESWPWQQNESMYKLGWEMYWCWQRSSGHWSVASKKHRYYGADMALGKDGIWYACIIVAD